MINSKFKFLSIVFHIILLIALLALTSFDPKGILTITIFPMILISLIIIFLIKDSKLILIPSILFILFLTISFALILIGNISWSEIIIYLSAFIYFFILIAETFIISKVFRKNSKEAESLN